MNTKGIDHIAIAVPNTEEALKLWRDQFGFTVLLSEVVNAGTVRLTHLDVGNAHLQLVEPLTADHPIKAWLAANGPGLHHICFKVDDVGEAMGEVQALGFGTAPKPHQGTAGKRAVFMDAAGTGGVRVELTGR